MRPFPDQITDPVYHPLSTYTRYQKFWLKHIHDKRDLPFIKLLTIIHLTIIPVGIFLFTDVLEDWHWWVAAGVYFYFSQFYFKGSFGLMFHCICHRKFFKTHPQLLTKYLCWFVCPFFGHVGDSYQVHHIGMHHIENNMMRSSIGAWLLTASLNFVSKVFNSSSMRSTGRSINKKTAIYI